MKNTAMRLNEGGIPKREHGNTLRYLIVASLGLALHQAGPAFAIIENGSIRLGVDDEGRSNLPGTAASPVTGADSVGPRHLATGNLVTSHGCLCEGWGVGIADAVGARVASGSADNDRGVVDLGLVSWTPARTP